jgi:hypothetical protein
MDERDIAIAAVMLPALIIIGGVVVMVWGIRHATRQAELQHEERMAMIERGITPPDIADRGERQRRAHGFKLSFGILLCGLGLGLVMLITFAAGEPGTGAGIGGAIVMVGLAFILSAMFTDGAGPRPASAAVPPWRDRAEAAPLVKRRDFDPPVPPSAE